jgi:hypothetical protein
LAGISDTPDHRFDIPYKDFNQVTSFVSSIGIAFSLNGAITVTTSSTDQSRELYGFASVAFVASLTCSTVGSLLVTSRAVVEYPYEDETLWILCAISYGSLACVATAFIIIGVALFETVGKGVGIAFISVIASLSVVGAFAYFYLERTFPRHFTQSITIASSTGPLLPPNHNP